MVGRREALLHRCEVSLDRQNSQGPGQPVDLRPEREEGEDIDQADETGEKISGNAVSCDQRFAPPEKVCHNGTPTPVSGHPKVGGLGDLAEQRQGMVSTQQQTAPGLVRGQSGQCRMGAGDEGSVRAGHHDALERLATGRGHDVGRCCLQGAINDRFAGASLPALDPAPAEGAVRVPVKDGLVLASVLVHLG